MPSLDIVSRVEFQELENALNNTKKALTQRFDFRGVVYTLELDKKEKKLKLSAEDNTKMEAIRETLKQNAFRRGLDLKVFKFGEQQPGAGGNLKQEITLLDGLAQDVSKDVVKASGLKVQASIQGEEVRVSGKKIDDLQAVMALLKGSELAVPLQFVNMKRD
jgi:cyclic-di-GMP-binding protein